MARIRSVHPGMASDEAYMSMSMAAKAAWPVLWTECDDHGVFEWKPIVLKARIFPADNVDFAAILAEYQKLGCVAMREFGGKSFGFVHNFCRFQRPKHPSYRYELPDKMHLFVGLSVSAPPVVGEASPPPTENPPQMKEEGGNKEEEKKEEGSALRADECATAPETVRRETKPKRQRAKPRIPLPDDWGLSARDREHAHGHGFDPPKIETMAAAFANHHRAHGNLMADWSAAWRKWCDNEIKFDRSASNGQRGPRAFQDDRLSLTKAADRLIERAERGEFTFGPRPSLLPESSENNLRLLSKG